MPRIRAKVEQMHLEGDHLPPITDQNLIGTGIRAFERVILLIRAYPFSVLALLIVLGFCGLGAGGYFILTNDKRWDEMMAVMRPSPAVETARFHLEAKGSAQIHDILERGIVTTGGDRISYSLFSNNQHGLPSGLTWSFTTVQDMALANGVAAGNLEAGDKLPNAYFAEYYSAVWADERNPKCAHFEVAKLKSSFLRARLKARGTREVIACPLNAADGTPMGMVFLGYVWRTKDDPTIPQATKQMTQIARDISDVFIAGRH